MQSVPHWLLMACHAWVCESSLFVARLFADEQPVHCHSSSFPLCNLKHHWLHTLTCMQSSKGCQIFSMINWLYFILFNTTTSLAFLECPRPHTCRKVCESSPPPYFSNCDHWWFDELQRDSGRVYGTAESGISSASFKVLHLTLVPVIFAIYTTPTFHLPCLPTSFFPQFLGLFCFAQKRYHIISKMSLWICFCKKVNIVSKNSHRQQWDIPPTRILTDVSLSLPIMLPHPGTLCRE